MTTEEERQERIAAFDAEADSPRPGWQKMLCNDSMERWFRNLPDGGSLTVMGIFPAVGFSYAVLGERGEIVERGISSRRGWAMDACEHYSAETRH